MVSEEAQNTKVGGAHSSATYLLCDGGQIVCPLWVSIA